MAVRLFVLGVLNERNAHGYEIKNLARQADLAQWASIGYGSIYHALRRLEDEELIEETLVEQQTGYPQRTVYRITDEGRNVFRGLLRKTCRSVTEPKYPVDLAIVFIGQLSPGERQELLEERLQTLKVTQKSVKEKLEQLDKGDPRFAGLRAVLRHDVMLRHAEIQWMRGLIDEVAEWPETIVPGIGRDD